jgi:stearoyl-CoA desaturase (delta-9 desaturase)
VWGFVVGTLAVFHATMLINSLAHLWGSRRYATSDRSRNNALLALVTFGEGWHNNHHHYMSAARQGFFWWEIDLTYYVLRLLARVGLVWDLREPPALVRRGARSLPGSTIPPDENPVRLR